MIYSLQNTSCYFCAVTLKPFSSIFLCFLPNVFSCRRTSVRVWRPSAAAWSCRGFKAMRFPGLRRGPGCSKKFGCSDATLSSSTWSSAGSLCTGGSAARTTLKRGRGTQRLVEEKCFPTRLCSVFSSNACKLQLHCLAATCKRIERCDGVRRTEVWESRNDGKDLTGNKLPTEKRLVSNIQP